MTKIATLGDVATTANAIGFLVAVDEKVPRDSNPMWNVLRFFPFYPYLLLILFLFPLRPPLLGVSEVLRISPFSSSPSLSKYSGLPNTQNSTNMPVDFSRPLPSPKWFRFLCAPIYPQSTETHFFSISNGHFMALSFISWWNGEWRAAGLFFDFVLFNIMVRLKKTGFLERTRLPTNKERNLRLFSLLLHPKAASTTLLCRVLPPSKIDSSWPGTCCCPDHPTTPLQKESETESSEG